MTHAVARTREPFQKDRAKHDAELPVLHILLARAAVIKERTEDHIDEPRIGNIRRHILASGSARHADSKIVIPGEAGDHLAKSVDLIRKLFGDVGFKALEVVREIQFDAGKRDCGAVLLRQAKFVPRHAQMADNTRKRADFRAFRNVVRHGVEPDVVIAAVSAIERIEAADHTVFFENTNVPIVLRKPNAGGQSGHSGADDYRVVYIFRRHLFENL